MGYMRHHAIVVTGWSEKDIVKVHQKACEIFKGISSITEITPEAVNGYRSFLIAPDGSKEWWDTSNAGDNARDNFIGWILRNISIHCNFAEVQFADENHDNKLLRSS